MRVEFYGLTKGEIDYLVLKYYISGGEICLALE